MADLDVVLVISAICPRFALTNYEMQRPQKANFILTQLSFDVAFFRPPMSLPPSSSIASLQPPLPNSRITKKWIRRHSRTDMSRNLGRDV